MNELGFYTLASAPESPLEPILDEYRRQRPVARFDHLSANPAGTNR